MEGRSATKASHLSLLSCLFFFFFFHGMCEVDGEPAPMEKAEQEALYLMVQGFVGSSWNGSGLYPDPCGWTPIQGVACDIFNGSWYITSVSIGPVLENSLQCSPNAKFSPELFRLTHLKSLTFFNCFSSPTTLPSKNWDSLAQTLETLEFRSNQGLVGEVPRIFGQLSSLRSLVLVENSLSGQLPQELGDLVHLKRLTISGNRLSGQIPASIGQNLGELLIMDLSRNALQGPLPASLGSLTSLLKLDVSYNSLNGSLPRELGGMKSLTLIDLRNNNLSGELLRSLEGLVSLQDMLLSNNPIGGSLNEFGWEKLANLANLDLSHMRLTGEIPESIEGMKRLRFLALNNNKLSGSVPPRIGALPSLNALYLNGNDFSGEIRFSEEFYRRVGRRFGCRDNPRLCYGGGVGPLGVQKCNNELLNSDNKVSRGNADDQSSSQSSSTGVSASWESGVLFVVMISVLLQ